MGFLMQLLAPAWAHWATSRGSAAEVRMTTGTVAVRGLARSDRDTAPALLVADIARDLWQLETGPELSSVFVRHESHSLPGVFLMGASVPIASASRAIASARKVMSRLSQVAPSTNELENWRSAELSAISPQSIADLWLDIETFNLASRRNQEDLIRDVTPTDVQRVAARLFKDASVATVVVGNYDQLKSSFDRNIELRSDKADVKTSVVPPTPVNKSPKKP